MASIKSSPKQTPRYATLPEAVEYCRSSRRSLERRIAEGAAHQVQERLSCARRP